MWLGYSDCACVLQRGAGGRIRTCVAFRRRFYRPVVLATHPPQQGSVRIGGALDGQRQSWALEPKGGLEPPTCRLQIGCAAGCATWAGSCDADAARVGPRIGEPILAISIHRRWTGAGQRIQPEIQTGLGTEGAKGQGHRRCGGGIRGGFLIACASRAAGTESLHGREASAHDDQIAIAGDLGRGGGPGADGLGADRTVLAAALLAAGVRRRAN